MDSSIRRVFVAICAVLICLACAGPAEIGINEDKIYEVEDRAYKHEYLLGPGDVLEIIYQYNPKPGTDVYRLAVGDIVKVEFVYHSEFDRKLTVLPDGKITLPRVGPVSVLDLTVEEVQEKLKALFEVDLRDPLISVTLEQYNRQIDYLKTAITTAPRGQSKLTPVRPDGMASFPLVNDVMAAGKTVPDLRAELQSMYEKLVDHMDVTLVLYEMKGNLAYIAGEVAKPNIYLMQGPTTVLQLVSMAQGFLPSAEKSTVLVISRDKDSRPWARLVNLQEEILEGNVSQDFVLQQFDVVYVPKTRVARRNLWVDQYINGLIPNTFELGYSLGGTLADHPPVIR